MYRLLILCFIFLSVDCKKKEDVKVVKLEGLGRVQGTKYWDGEFYEFHGIPYATAPSGRDKYKAPLPPEPWKETMEAKRQIVLCPQVYFMQGNETDDGLYGETDCLLANLYVPKVASDTNLLPVMIYVHSGGFAGGSASMAKYYNVAKNDLIVISINYRVGALGFACLGTEDIPGNAALKDIIAALKWVNKHVKSFGGDPSKVTLAGYSVGATLVELVAMSKESKGLFDKIILDSGSALAPFAINRDPIATATNIAVSLGLEGPIDLEELTEFYLEESLQGIQNKSKNFFLTNSTFGFAPCIEKPGPGAVLTESPLDIMKRGDYPDFAVLIGFSDKEGISRTSQFEAWKSEMNKNFADFLPGDLKFDNVKDRDAFIKEIKQKYFNGKDITDESLHGYIDYFSDSMFKYSIIKSAKLHAQKQNRKRSTYLYEFTYVGKLNTKHLYHDKVFGASHRDQTAYILDFYDWTRNFTDMDMRDRMITMWVDFVMFENPTAFESKLIKTMWKKYTKEDPNYFEIGYELVNKKNLFEESFQFWDKVYEKHYWTPTPPKPELLIPTSKKPVKLKKPKVEEVKPEKTETSEEAEPIAKTENVKPQDTKTPETKLKDVKEESSKKVDESKKSAPPKKNVEDEILKN